MRRADVLRDGLTALGVELPDDAVDALLSYVDMLAKWNRVYNLTGIAEDRFVESHLLDSLAIAPYLAGERVVDVGSGGGLPGIPLAIRFPERRFTLLDSNARKTRFLEQARIDLALDNVDVVQARVERFAGQFDAVVCRAFASLADIAAMTAHLLVDGGRLYAMKGSLDGETRDEIPTPLQIDQVLPLTVPGIAGERHLVVLGKGRPQRWA